VSNVSRWRDSGHLERAVQTAGGQERFDAAVAAMLDDAPVRRLAEMPKRLGVTQESDFPRSCISGLPPQRSLSGPPGDQPGGQDTGSPGSRA